MKPRPKQQAWGTRRCSTKKFLKTSGHNAFNYNKEDFHYLTLIATIKAGRPRARLYLTKPYDEGIRELYAAAMAKADVKTPQDLPPLNVTHHDTRFDICLTKRV